MLGQEEFGIGDNIYIPAHVSGASWRRDGVTEIRITERNPGMHDREKACYLNVCAKDESLERVLVPKADVMDLIGSPCFVMGKVTDIDGNSLSIEIGLESGTTSHKIHANRVPSPEEIEDALFDAKIVTVERYDMGAFRDTLEAVCEERGLPEPDREMIEDAAGNFRQNLKCGLGDRISDSILCACRDAVDERKKPAQRQKGPRA